MSKTILEKRPLSDPLIVWAGTKGPKTKRALHLWIRAVVFYAVVSDEIQRVIEWFHTHAEAEATLARVLADEPDWREIMSVQPIVPRTGTTN